jgi:ATP-dependent DNA helicase RecG
MKEPEHIELLLKEGEGLTIEYKEHFTPRIAEDMVAFANTRGGTGIKRMRDAMKSESLPPPKIDADNFFFITLRRLQIGSSIGRDVGMEKTTQKTTQKTTMKTTMKILELMQENVTVTRAELADATSLTPDGIKWHIAKLKAQGRIRRIGPDKGGRWEVMEQ